MLRLYNKSLYFALLELSVDVNIDYIELGEDIKALLQISSQPSDNNEILLSMQVIVSNEATGLNMDPIVVTNNMVFGVADNCESGDTQTQTDRQTDREG